MLWTPRYYSSSRLEFWGYDISSLSPHIQHSDLSPLLPQASEMEDDTCIWLDGASRRYELARKRIIHTRDFLIVFNKFFHIVELIIFCSYYVSLYQIQTKRLGLSHRSRCDLDDTTHITHTGSSQSCLYPDRLSWNWQDDNCSYTRKVSQLQKSATRKSMSHV